MSKEQARLLGNYSDCLASSLSRNEISGCEESRKLSHGKFCLLTIKIETLRVT